jgi:hypothetical protein
MKKFVPVSQTLPAEPANNEDNDKSRGENMAPQYGWFFLKDTCLTEENYPDSKMVLVKVNHRIDRIPFLHLFLKVHIFFNMGTPLVEDFSGR